LFEADAGLLSHAPAAQRELLRRNFTVPALELERGACNLPDEPSLFALLVVEGSLTRHVDFFGHRTAEVLGPGDLILAGERFGIGPQEYPVSWSSLTSTRLALLDLQVERRLRGVTGVATALLYRYQRRLDAITLQANLARKRGIPARLLVYLWHLAERLGDRRQGGVALRVPLGHALLADLISAERASVSRALAVLKALGYVRRGQKQCWTLCGSVPPDFDRVELELESFRGEAVAR